MLLNLPYYNINWNNEYQYSYLLHVLIRITRLVEKQKITKDDFIKKCIEWWISKRTAYRVWNDWAYKNQFIKYVSDNREYLYISWKDTFKTIIEKVPEYIYKNIKGINSLKDFLHYAYLGKMWIDTDKVKTWKWLYAIARDTKTSITTVCNKNKKCVKIFWLIKKNRYWVFNEYFIRLTNTYTSWIRLVNNKYCAVIRQVKKIYKHLSLNLAPLFNVMNFKKWKVYKFLSSDNYSIVNQAIYNNLII